MSICLFTGLSLLVLGRCGSTVPRTLRTKMRAFEVLAKSAEVPLKNAPAGADVPRGMADLDGGIVEQYADHLSRKASSAVMTMAVAGAVAGAVLGAIPGM